MTGLIDQTFLFSSPLWIETKEARLNSSLLALDTNESAKTDIDNPSKIVNETLNGVEKPLRKSKRTKVRNRWINFDENMENSSSKRQKVTILRQEITYTGNNPNGKLLRGNQRTRVMPNNNDMDISVAMDGQQSTETDVMLQLLRQFNESFKHESGYNIKVADNLENCGKVKEDFIELTGKESDRSEERVKMSVIVAKSNKQKKVMDAST